MNCIYIFFFLIKKILVSIKFKEMNFPLFRRVIAKEEIQIPPFKINNFNVLDFN